MLRALAIVVCAAACGAASPSVATSEYAHRRQALSRSLSYGAVILYGVSEAEAEDFREPFHQEPNFFYLTGWKEPGAILLLVPDAAPAPHEILFLPEHNKVRERYSGPRAAPTDNNISDLTGFEVVEPTKSFEGRLSGAFRDAWKVYTIPGQPSSERLKSLLPKNEVRSVVPLIAPLRAKKSASEIALIQRSVDSSVAAHRAAWSRIGPGVAEYQVAAVMTAAMMDAGCERNAYAPVIGSGPNSNVLHYSANSRRMEAGEVVLIDAGAECDGFAADITRTLPVGKDFTARQREVYEIVLGAQQAAIAAAKPGATMRDMQKAAVDYLNSHGELGKYMTHGVSHHVGLEVHDPQPGGRALEPGMVITAEPGVYLPEEGFGIRIEDTLLITESGARVMSAALPSDWDTIRKQRKHRP
jgi:Xaa-Pro aminopeptidase